MANYVLVYSGGKMPDKSSRTSCSLERVGGLVRWNG